MNEILNGKKTYLVAAGILIASALAFLQGEIDLATAIARVLEGLGLAALRMGVAKVGNGEG